MRRRAVLLLAAMLAVFSCTFVAGAQPAAALAPPPVIIPAAASATTVAAGVTGVGLVLLGGWWAYNNTDTIARWYDETFGTNLSGNAMGSGRYTWSPATPDPGGGPYPMAQWYGVEDWSADLPFSIKCELPAGQYCNGFTGDYDVKATIICQTSTGDLFSYENWSAPRVQGGQSWWGGFVPCTGAGQKVVSVVDPTHGLSWNAAGDWQKNRVSTATVQCTDATTGALRTVSKITPYVATTANMNAPVPGCLPGEYASDVSVQDCLQGQASTCRTTIHWAVNPGAKDQYPDCFSAGALGTCALSIKYKGDLCDETMVPCRNWYARVLAGNVADFKCYWGAYAVPITSCRPIADLYVPDSVVDPDTDLPTAPQPQPSPSTSSTAGPLPTTGPNPTTSPTASGAPSPAGTRLPTNNPTPVPTSIPTTPPEPQPNPPGSEGCMDDVWTWNPVSWVLVPVKCALVWAFVPDGATVNAVRQSAGTAWATSGPGVMTTAVLGAVEPLGDIGSAESGACGLVVDFPPTGTTLHLLDACTEPMSTYAPWVKGFLTVVVIVNGAWFLLRVLTASLGLNLPGRGGESS
jgi:hypothetical protein